MKSCILSIGCFCLTTSYLQASVDDSYEVLRRNMQAQDEMNRKINSIEQQRADDVSRINNEKKSIQKRINNICQRQEEINDRLEKIKEQQHSLSIEQNVLQAENHKLTNEKKELEKRKQELSYQREIRMLNTPEEQDAYDHRDALNRVYQESLEQTSKNLARRNMVRK